MKCQSQLMQSVMRSWKVLFNRSAITPGPNDRYRAHIKQYGTKFLSMIPNGLRTGMTAKVTILSEQIEDALQIPSRGFRKKGQAYCLVAGEEQELELREIELGPNNMSHAVVRSGLGRRVRGNQPRSLS